MQWVFVAVVIMMMISCTQTTSSANNNKSWNRKINPFRCGFVSIPKTTTQETTKRMQHSKIKKRQIFSMRLQNDDYYDYDESVSIYEDHEEKKEGFSRRKTRIRPRRPTSTSSSSSSQDGGKEEQKRKMESKIDPTLIDFGNISFANDTILQLSAPTKRAIDENLHLKQMTEIQSRTYFAARNGLDILGRARTGTGKTLAFLLPIIERLVASSSLSSLSSSLTAPSSKSFIFRPGRDIGALIICPTRELATQIGNEATRLLQFHHTSSSSSYYSSDAVQVVCGGTKIGRDIALFNRQLPWILVGTPGRLLDHALGVAVPSSSEKQKHRRTTSGGGGGGGTRVANGRKFGSDILSSISMVVLDEADRLLMDMGFRHDVIQILSFLPRKEKRQTMLFTATMPKSLRFNVLSDVMMFQNDKQFFEVDCVNNNDDHDATDATDDDNNVPLFTKQQQQQQQGSDPNNIISTKENNQVTTTSTKDTTTLVQTNNNNNKNVGQINAGVSQNYVLLSPQMKYYVESIVQILLHTILPPPSSSSSSTDQHEHDDGIKILAFFPTTRAVGYFADLFRYGNLFRSIISENNNNTDNTDNNNDNDIQILEIHSKKSHGHRIRSSNQFRLAHRAILFTSDVSARGIDYPDVTHVIQFGMPESKEHYIHRLGRTARAGRRGKGLLVLHPFEKPFLSQIINSFDITLDQELQTALYSTTTTTTTNDNTNNNSSSSLYYHNLLYPIMDRIHNEENNNNNNHHNNRLSSNAKQTYQAFLGYYIDRMKMTTIQSKQELVYYAKELCIALGLGKNVPMLEERLVKKLGLEGLVETKK